MACEKQVLGHVIWLWREGKFSLYRTVMLSANMGNVVLWIGLIFNIYPLGHNWELDGMIPVFLILIETQIIMKYLFAFLLFSTVLLACECEPDDSAPCTDNFLIEYRVIEADCAGLDGQIIFSNPNRALGATFQWSHNDEETGDNVSPLKSDLYKVTVTYNGEERVTQIMLN